MKKCFEVNIKGIWTTNLIGDCLLAIDSILAGISNPESVSVMHIVRDDCCINYTVLVAKMDAVLQNGTGASLRRKST